MKSFDVIIIGAGFAGVATAYHLSKIFSGKILILEKEPEIGSHASGRNAGLLRQAVERSDVASFISETLAALISPPDDWETPISFKPSGSILLGNLDRLKALRANLKNPKQDAEILLHADIASHFPSPLRELLLRIAAPALLHTFQDGIVNPKVLLKNFLDAALLRDVCLKTSSQVSAIRRLEKNWEVQTQSEKFSASVLVNAAGAWASSLALGIAEPAESLVPHRRHLYLCDSVAGFEANFPFLWDLPHEVYLRPHLQGTLWSAGDEEPHFSEGPDLDPMVEKILQDKMKFLFPEESSLHVNEAWACLRTKSSSGRFLLDWDARAEGFFWAAALGGHGLSACFGAGRAAAERISRFFA